MCFEYDSVPPIPPIAGASVSHRRLELQATDGNHFRAFLAEPDEAASVGVVVLPDVRGLYPFYEEVALRFAERGIAALAIDYFGRTAGIGKRDGFFEYVQHITQTTYDGVQADVQAAVEQLRDLGCEDVFTLGFCFGGTTSWLAAAACPGLAGAIGFYGHPAIRAILDGPEFPTAIDRAPAMSCPILALAAGNDQSIPAELYDEFERALKAAGVEHEIVTYEGAPHSFFDRMYAEHIAASQDAWERVLGFIAAHSATPSAAP